MLVFLSFSFPHLHYIYPPPPSPVVGGSSKRKRCCFLLVGNLLSCHKACWVTRCLRKPRSVLYFLQLWPPCNKHSVVGFKLCDFPCPANVYLFSLFLLAWSIGDMSRGTYRCFIYLKTHIDQMCLLLIRELQNRQDFCILFYMRRSLNAPKTFLFVFIVWLYVL